MVRFLIALNLACIMLRGWWRCTRRRLRRTLYRLMPKRKLHIPAFQGIVAPAADPSDLDPGDAAYAEDVDLVSMPGTVQGLPEHRLVYTGGTWNDVQKYALVAFEEPSVDNPLVAAWTPADLDHPDDKVRVWEVVSESDIDEYAALEPPEDINLAPVDASAHRGSVRLGIEASIDPGETPLWVGRPRHSQFGDPAPSGLECELAPFLKAWEYNFTISSADVTEGGSTTDDTLFTQKSTFIYSLALRFDEYQENVPVEEERITLTGDVAEIDVTITHDTSSGALPTRVSAVVLYRTGPLVQSTGDAPPEPQHVATIRLDDGGWYDDGDLKKYDVTDEGDPGQTFTARTGLPHELDTQLIGYLLTETGGGYHFVGRASVEGVDEDLSHQVFRSKAYRPDMFDWSTDYVTLPRQPRALAYHRGELLAMADGETYVIDAERLTVVQTIPGIGIRSPKAAVSTNAGVFWADRGGLYVYDGERVRHVGGPILESEEGVASWRGDAPNIDFDTWTGGPRCAYDAKQNVYVVLFNNENEGGVQGWAWHLPDQRWTEDLPRGVWTRLSGTTAAAGTLAYNWGLVSVRGSLFAAADEDWHNLFGSNQRSGWTWRSPRLDLGRPAHEKWFYAALLRGNALFEAAGGGEMRWRLDGGSWSTPVQVDAMSVASGMHRHAINPASTPPYATSNDVQVEITGPSNGRLRTLSIEWRPKIESAFSD